MLTSNKPPDSGVNVTVVSTAAGRMRLRFDGCRFDSVWALRIEDTVGKLTGVRAVQGYTRTASIVIWYSPARCNAAAILSSITDSEQIAASVTARALDSGDTSKPGVAQHIIDWAARTLSGSRDDAQRALPVSGSDVSYYDDDDEQEREPEGFWQVAKVRRATWSGSLLTASVVAAWIPPLRPVALAMKVLALAVGASTFVPSSVKRMSQGRMGVGDLMTTAALGAVGLGQIGDAAKMAFLFSMTEGLGEYSATRTHRSLRALLSLAPRHATILREGIETVVAATDLRVGDQMIVKAGQRLATDGIIRAGRTVLDRSAITGESAPVVAGPGDQVFAGSTNGHGVLQVEVTATAANNSLARIAHIMEAQQTLEDANQELADRTARPLVPGLLIAAVLVAVTGGLFGSPAVWIQRALIVLATGSPYALEVIGIINGFASDNIKTLAAHRPMVVDAASTNGARREEVPVALGAPGSNSEHALPVAVA